jgi:hypothetical protein
MNVKVQCLKFLTLQNSYVLKSEIFPLTLIALSFTSALNLSLNLNLVFLGFGFDLLFEL